MWTYQADQNNSKEDVRVRVPLGLTLELLWESGVLDSAYVLPPC